MKSVLFFTDFSIQHRELDNEKRETIRFLLFLCRVIAIATLHLRLARAFSDARRAESIPQKLSSRNDSHPGFVSSIPTFLNSSVYDSSDWTTVIDNGVMSLHLYDRPKPMKCNHRL
jgi:hypothetical protein